MNNDHSSQSSPSSKQKQQVLSSEDYGNNLYSSSIYQTLDNNHNSNNSASKSIYNSDKKPKSSMMSSSPAAIQDDTYSSSYHSTFTSGTTTNNDYHSQSHLSHSIPHHYNSEYASTFSSSQFSQSFHPDRERDRSYNSNRDRYSMNHSSTHDSSSINNHYDNQDWSGSSSSHTRDYQLGGRGSRNYSSHSDHHNYQPSHHRLMQSSSSSIINDYPSRHSMQSDHRNQVQYHPETFQQQRRSGLGYQNQSDQDTSSIEIGNNSRGLYDHHTGSSSSNFSRREDRYHNPSHERSSGHTTSRYEDLWNGSNTYTSTNSKYSDRFESRYSSVYRGNHQSGNGYNLNPPPRRFDPYGDRHRRFDRYDDHRFGGSDYSQSNSTVQSFYNSKRDFGVSHRNKLQTIHVRVFHNWVKSVLIQKYGEKARAQVRDESQGDQILPDNFMYVLDAACGKGGDHKKWMMHSKTAFYVGVDIAYDSLKEAHKRSVKTLDEIKSFAKVHSNIKFGFFGKDLTLPSDEFWKHILAEKSEAADENNREFYKQNSDYMFDIVSCQMAMHYMLQDEAGAKNFLDNCAFKLNDAGYLLLTFTDSNVIKNIIKNKAKVEGNHCVYRGKHFSIRYPSVKPNTAEKSETSNLNSTYSAYKQKSANQNDGVEPLTSVVAAPIESTNVSGASTNNAESEIVCETEGNLPATEEQQQQQSETENNNGTAASFAPEYNNQQQNQGSDYQQSQAEETEAKFDSEQATTQSEQQEYKSQICTPRKSVVRSEPQSLQKQQEQTYNDSSNFKESEDVDDDSQLYGKSYDFYLQEAVGVEEDGIIQYVPEYFVNVNAFIELAKEFDLEVVENSNFIEFYERNQIEYNDLLRSMKVSYSEEKDQSDPDSWEISHCYRVLVFQKTTKTPSRYSFDRSTRDKFLYKYPIPHNFVPKSQQTSREQDQD